MVRTSPFPSTGCGFQPWWEAEIPPASWPKSKAPVKPIEQRRRHAADSVKAKAGPKENSSEKKMRGKCDESTHGEKQKPWGSAREEKLVPAGQRDRALGPVVAAEPPVAAPSLPRGGWPSDGWQGVGRLAPVILAVQPRDSLGSTLSRWCPPQGGAWRRQGLIFQF